MSALSPLKALVPEAWRQSLRSVQVALSFKHLSGPTKVVLSPNEAAVTCVVKNGQFFLAQFLEHYFDLGFKHVFLLDNGSTDGTLEQAARHQNVTVYQSTLSVGKYQGLLKRRLAEIAVPNGWCLDVDIDEFFDYPYSQSLPLARFLDYLNAKGYTAVVTQMLDMFSDRSLSSLDQEREHSLKRVHRYYDVSDVRRASYFEENLTATFGTHNVASSAETAVYWGGIRKKVYGVDVLLTKHSLFRTGVGLELFRHNHYIDKAVLADVSCLLLHFKFADNANAAAAQNRVAFTANRDHYDRMLEVNAKQPNARIKGDEAKEYSSSEELLESGFLFASEDYRAAAR